jgi:hypothetical protein
MSSFDMIKFLSDRGYVIVGPVYNTVTLLPEWRVVNTSYDHQTGVLLGYDDLKSLYESELKSLARIERIKVILEP